MVLNFLSGITLLKYVLEDMPLYLFSSVFSPKIVLKISKTYKLFSMGGVHKERENGI